MDKIDPKLNMDGKTVKDMPTPISDNADRNWQEYYGAKPLIDTSVGIEKELQFLKGLLAEYLQYNSSDGNNKRQILRAKIKELIK